MLDRLAGDDAGRVAAGTCMYWSKIHAITWALVFMSGAGMSCLVADDVVDAVDELAREALELALLSSRGLHAMPPLAPPNGTSTTAVFQVISVASAVTSSASTSGW